jgi:protein-tyrosine phosphatase
MVDLHHHLLPGLDDGSPDLGTSVRMARMAWDDGITHVVCTPHASHRYEFSPERVAASIAELRAALDNVDIPLQLGFGCDFHLSYDNLRDALAEPARYTINHGEYLLVELPDHGIPPTLDETFYDLRLHGMTPILTHPERNLTLQNNPKLLAAWVRNGLLVQVTANSVTGGMGKRAQRLAHQFLADRWVHFLATDAHNVSSRPPVLSAARDQVAKSHGDDYAELLCTTNPAAVFASNRLPPQLEPLHLEEDHDDGTPPWYQRIFSKFKLPPKS